MIVDNDEVRLKITDDQGDSVFTHGLEPDGSLVLTCHDGDTDEYAAVQLKPREIQALIGWLQGHGSRCPACIEHPGWAQDDQLSRQHPEDYCPTCLGAGRIVDL